MSSAWPMGYVPQGVRDGTLRVCPTCNGSGINPVATYAICPKCNGEKYVKRLPGQDGPPDAR